MLFVFSGPVTYSLRHRPRGKGGKRTIVVRQPGFRGYVHVMHAVAIIIRNTKIPISQPLSQNLKGPFTIFWPDQSQLACYAPDKTIS